MLCHKHLRALKITNVISGLFWDSLGATVWGWCNWILYTNLHQHMGVSNITFDPVLKRQDCSYIFPSLKITLSTCFGIFVIYNMTKFKSHVLNKSWTFQNTSYKYYVKYYAKVIIWNSRTKQLGLYWGYIINIRFVCTQLELILFLICLSYGAVWRLPGFESMREIWITSTSFGCFLLTIVWKTWSKFYQIIQNFKKTKWKYIILVKL